MRVVRDESVRRALRRLGAVVNDGHPLVLDTYIVFGEKRGLVSVGALLLRTATEPTRPPSNESEARRGVG